jgi:prepilin-type N-terminal cleavage/methylation domain-containing protein
MSLRASGFSLVELVSVMVIIGILSVYAVAKIKPSSTNHYQYCREISIALKRTQSINMNQALDINIFFKSQNQDDNSKIALCFKDDCDTDSELFDVSIFKGVTLTETKIRFNEYGQPVDTNGKRFNNDLIYNLGDTGECSVTVSKEGVISWQ